MKPISTQWLLFIVSLPTISGTARMRIWRSLKSLGCAALRDGAYLLPDRTEQKQALIDLSEETVREGGVAWLLTVQPQSDAESATYLALFDRGNDYVEWQKNLAETRKSLADALPVDITKALRKFRRDYDVICSIDYFPNEASAQAQAAWMDFVQLADSILSPGEPHAVSAAITLLDQNQYQGRTWATRKGLWVDRVASAWLIRHFIDREARFLWLESVTACPPDALGFDFDGASFTHIGERVSFEVLLASFGLESDRGLLRLAAMVHVLDVGEGFVPEASGFEAMLAGARQRAQDDDHLLAAVSIVLDALYLHFSNDSPTQYKNKEKS
ncbi:MAG: chromate resistance protein ChrB domain-containing protein [Pseudomonadota bacterium]